MYYLENKDVEGIHYSRFIASWMNVTSHYRESQFEKWLRSLIINGRHLTDVEVYEIKELARCGKLELEMDAKAFIDSHKGS